MKVRNKQAQTLASWICLSLLAAAGAAAQIALDDNDAGPSLAAQADEAASQPEAPPAGSDAAGGQQGAPGADGIGAAAEDATVIEALRRTRDAFLLAEDFSAALGPAERLVGLLDRSGDPALARDLARLARIQAELEDFTAAELNYLSAIELISDMEGEFSINLLEPYQGLGRSYIRDRRFPEAVITLEQAQHVSQRNLGLFNVTQTELIDDLTTAHLGMGDTSTAQGLQLERLDNAIRRFGVNNPQIIPFRYRLAGYYDQSRMREAAREQYEHVVTLLDARPDAGESVLLEPLRQLLRLEILLRDEDAARTRLQSILDSRPDIDPAERALSLAALGDWAIAHEDLPTAREYYTEAYRTINRAPDKNADELFAQPVMLDFVAPLSPVDRGTRSRPYAWGSILLEFQVSADGRAYDVETVAAMPAGVMDDAYDRRVRETHFRPRIVAGELRATEEVRFTHYFRYYVNEDD